ncbi:MAG: AAA family ATPase [bacterium]
MTNDNRDDRNQNETDDHDPDQEQHDQLDGDENQSTDDQQTLVLYRLAEAVESFFQESAHPHDLLKHDSFLQGVSHLTDQAYSASDLMTYGQGDNEIIACMALETLHRLAADPELVNTLVDSLEGTSAWRRFFILKVLSKHAPAEINLVGELVWFRYSASQRFYMQFLRDFIHQRIAAGERPTFGDRLLEVDEEQRASLRRYLKQLRLQELNPLRRELVRPVKEENNLEYFQQLGVLWQNGPPAHLPPCLDHPVLTKHVASLKAALCRKSPRSVLLVGEHGVGKSAIVQALGREIGKEGWLIFEAKGAELIAGKKYIGEFEEQLVELVRNLRDNKKIIWYAPDFAALEWTGRHEHKPMGALDHLLPHIESGQILVIGEVRTAAFEQLVQTKPHCLTAMEICRVEPLTPAETQQLARQWAARHGHGQASNLIADAVLQEAWQLARHYLRDRAAPGNLLEFLELTRKRLTVQSPATHITVDDLIITLTNLTGLPADILDDRQQLALGELRSFFGRRIMGQSEAVDCLVERIAMIKAGLTDPTRPQGVFLLAGPTGTGKTEIAKTLASYLFSSEARLVRLDMSEYQTPNSVDRLLGNMSDRDEQSLAYKIRKQPFSVVLLDEFEKAYPAVWDLFLQVFDDGRLTDRQGKTVDFRHAIIVLTTNLGASRPTGTSLGFAQEQEVFQPAAIERTMGQVFRPEFLNRIDRVIIFRPFTREIMRKILAKELDDAYQRRGLRNRSWAVLWDDAATEFLIEKGFSTRYGARPLKRAIDQYLLAPLALTIVDFQVPEGEQFLFVHSDGEKLDVEFCDPDSPASAGEAASEVADPADDSLPPLTSVILDPLGTPAEITSLQAHYDQRLAYLESESWRQEKEAALSMMSLADFWNSPERFAILGEVEYRDRIEAAMESAGALLERLIGSSDETCRHYPRNLVGRLAQQFYLVGIACLALEQRQSWEAFLLVEASSDPKLARDEQNQFASKLGDMYRQWAKKRRMRLDVLERHSGDANRPFRLLLSISGFGGLAILSPEDGIHVWEQPRGDGAKAFVHYEARVRVLAQPEEPPSEESVDLLTQARDALREPEAAPATIVRRYRELPSPLVRDRVRQGRTGRLDRVLAGDFDLILAPEDGGVRLAGRTVG